ncbi:MAG: hypothetical protein IJS50_02995, partial [Desulfovibrio sp.]|nr:hypothetical protein [Desulfovibrio sp.]
YETMDKGTSFAEMIICQDAYLKILKDLFADCESFQMGRSRSSGYGTVRLTKLEEVNLPEQFVLAPGTHTFFLPSPFIPEKSWESPLKGFLAELSKYLGEVELVPEQVFCALTRADGYNNYWDMPRCTRIGLAAGSVITVVTKQKGNLPLALGQSLPEGYGRFLVDLPLLKEEKPVLTIGEQPSSATSGQSEAMVPGKLLQVWRKRSMERLAKEEAFDCVWNSTVFEEFLLSLRSYNRPSANQRSNFQRLIMGQDQKAWIPAFREILSKQPGRQWKTVRPADPFSTLNRRGNLDEIMLKLLDAEGTDALVSKLYAPFQTLPELPGAPMTPEEQASYRLARHKLLLIELLRRWEKENHAWEGGK